VGDRKLKTFRRFRDLYLEYDFFFFGDNGQGDFWAAEQMLEEQRIGRNTENTASLDFQQKTANILGVFIHEVTHIEKTLCQDNPSMRNEEWREHQERNKLWLFRSYVGAALALYQRYPDIITAEMLATIANQAIDEFDTARLMYHDWTSSWDQAEEDLRADLNEVDEYLLDAALQPGLALKELRTQSELLESQIPCATRSLYGSRSNSMHTGMSRQWAEVSDRMQGSFSHVLLAGTGDASTDGTIRNSF
jgi:hypothetical protein